MCGVIGFFSEKNRKDLGIISAKMLRMLEYRGYDSTGAIIQDDSKNIVLRKDVGSPTIVTKELKIGELEGQIFCGQVRWATFGSVTKENAQPHEVKCHTHIYGAHNGNITNCDQLKIRLTELGHDIKSDNDGEMLVHTIEHYFAQELEKIDKTNNEDRKNALMKAIITAYTKTVGSFASVVVDPVSETMACIKAGSSLYMGKGFNEKTGSFVVCSSDLSAVLSQTKILIPIKEKEFAIFTAEGAEVFDIRTGEKLERTPFRSNLKIEETELGEEYKFFMEQEINAQVNASKKLINLFTGNSEHLEFVKKLQSERPDLIKNLKHAILQMSEITNSQELKTRSTLFTDSEVVNKINELTVDSFPKGEETELDSGQSVFLKELNAIHKENMNLNVKLLDSIFLYDEVNDIKKRINHFVDMMVKAYEYGSSIYLIACGTSFHAAKSAAIFFDRIAGLSLYPLLPGEFRAQHANSIRDKDVVIGVSQSGETKDLIDIFNMVRDSGKDVTLISIVNNTNSSLAQEKSELFIPLFCGPEIAVPATKSFLNQLIVLYILSIKVAERFVKLGIKTVEDRKIEYFTKQLFKIPEYIKATIENTKDSIDEISETLYLEPSMHILATGMLGIAKEGALKIREVVLNHTEGFEGSEFKHGPNTILGVNTIFGMNSIKAVLDTFSTAFHNLKSSDKENRFTTDEILQMFKSTTNYAFGDGSLPDLEDDQREFLIKTLKQHNFFESLYNNYPLIFVTNPSDRDVNLTISQINTHKIRGANVFVIAEKNNFLKDAIEKVPDSLYKSRYKSGYIELPETGDELMPTFTSTIVFQLLALKMSILKMSLMTGLNIRDHGVHPDSPKNVSKSITVD